MQRQQADGEEIPKSSGDESEHKIDPSRWGLGKPTVEPTPRESPKILGSRPATLKKTPLGGG